MLTPFCIKTTRTRRNLQPFTLVELLIVIAIIVILASLLLPVLGKVREVALGIKCVNNYRQIGFSAQQFASDNRGRGAGGARRYTPPNTTDPSIGILNTMVFKKNIGKDMIVRGDKNA